MTDTKITALATLTSLDPAADWFVAVDVSDTSMAATGTDKRVTRDTLLADYIAALGKVVTSGFNPGNGALVTLFDPNAATWDAGQWWAFERDNAGGVRTSSLWLSQLLGHAYAQFTVDEDGNTPSRSSQFHFAAEDDADNHQAFALISTRIHPDGTLGFASFDLKNQSNGAEVYFEASTNGAVVQVFGGSDGTPGQLQAFGGTGQTAPLLDLESATAPILTVAPDGSVGGVAPSNGWSIKWNAVAGQWIAAA